MYTRAAKKQVTVDPNEQSLLCSFATDSKWDNLEQKLSAANAGSCDSEKRTLLMLTVMSRNQSSNQIVDKLISYGADVNALDQFENSALHYACKVANTDAVRKLLNKGAKSTALNSKGQMPIELVLIKSQFPQKKESEVLETIKAYHSVCNLANTYKIRITFRTYRRLAMANGYESVNDFFNLLSGQSVSKPSTHDPIKNRTVGSASAAGKPSIHDPSKTMAKRLASAAARPSSTHNSVNKKTEGSASAAAERSSTHYSANKKMEGDLESEVRQLEEENKKLREKVDQLGTPKATKQMSDSTAQTAGQLYREKTMDDRPVEEKNNIRLDEMKKDMVKQGEMHQAEMAELKNHMADMKNQMGDMKNHMGDMKNHMGDMKNHMADMKNHMADMKNFMMQLEQQGKDKELFKRLYNELKTENQELHLRVDELTKEKEELNDIIARSKQDTFKVTEPLGLCLIINNMNYTPSELIRKGSDKDVAKIEEVFKKIGFEISTEKDLKADQMQRCMEDFRRIERHSKYGMAVVFIMAHGQANSVFGIDGVPVKVQTMTDPFENCENLKHKPKVIFIQACRKSADAVPSNSTLADDDFNLPADAYLPSKADFMFNYSNAADSVAYRDMEKGSPFIQKMCEKIQELYEITDLMSIATLVSKELREWVDDRDGQAGKIVTEIRSTLSHKVVLSPKLEWHAKVSTS